VKAHNGAGTDTAFSSTTSLATSAGGCTPPTINTPTFGATACAGATVTFSVDASGTTWTYQWRKNGVPLTDGATGNGSTYGSVTTATMGITNVQSADAAISANGFDCVVTENSSGPCNSTTAPRWL